MKRKVLFWKLYPLYLFICLIGIGVTVFLAQYSFKNFYYKETSERLLEKSSLVKIKIKNNILNSNFQALSEQINLISQLTNDRITIILPEGKVVADSNENPIFMENHRNRPEFKSALKGEIGRSSRTSATINTRHIYLAVPLVDNGKVIAVLRHSVSVDELDKTLNNYSLNLAWFLVTLLIILSLIIAWHTKLISSPLEKMKLHAEKLSEGDFSDQIALSNDEPSEIYKLSKTLNQMGVKIDKQLKKIMNQKSELDAIFSSMQEGIITVDNNGNLYHVNDFALKVFNLTLKLETIEELKGRPLEELIRLPKINEIVKSVIDSQSDFEDEIELANKKVLEIKAAVLRAPDNHQIGVVLVINDVTRLRELEFHRKQFVANVSHELRTPLTSIRGFVETILDSDIDDKELVDKFLNIIKNQAIRLNTIIDDLLSLSDLEKGQDIELVVGDVNAVVSSAVEICGQRAKGKNVTLSFARSNPIKANINNSLLEQAVINLIVNAIKYGGENKEVKICVESLNEEAIISVVDQGPGIAKEHHDRLFERFYAVDKARSRNLGGSGLGLSIVKHIILLHSGRVAVKSEVGKGSEFQIVIPLNNS